ncbi:hypothetical protein PPMP20_15350 [Paraburkholderia phymatum]|uniref:SnoaL-like domain-containing protein n=1 Tax=Paraburkholderia phymatum (strain DSM 17167 / CIP 108236 / LMG 21445 / STM815) TaxID=391038 RepID=B2JPV5_PARP8|nr:hypothetical protein [Paraburkholderia phymatum]ACC73296.1 conserved hypothetical protein [Paraburkholderia phymatum STM815]
MSTLKDSIESYILAKDGNRPHRMTDAFAPNASLAMTVKTSAIAFPRETQGRDAIATVLASDFARKYENVYTFCVGAMPADGQCEFSCDWLVCMTEKTTGATRVGYGRYDWTAEARTARVTRLHIAIEEMETLPATSADCVLRWASSLPYPWCERVALDRDAPGNAAVQRIIRQLTR